MIRWLIRRDLPEVRSINRLCYLDFFSEDDFVRLLRSRTMIGKVYEHREDGTLAGYMLYTLVSDHFEIVDFGVDPAYRRQGIGREFIQHLKEKLSETRRTYIDFPVSEHNLALQMFLKTQGFVGSYENGIILFRYGHVKVSNERAQ